MRGIEQGDAFEVTERIVVDDNDPNGGHFGLNIQYRGLAGKRAADVLDGMRFIRALAEHNNIVVRPEFGPQEVARGPAAGQQWEGVVPMAQLVENLAVLQRRTMLPIVVPQVVPPEEYAQIAVAAHLIEGGETDGNWSDASVEPVDVEEAREWIKGAGDEGGPLALPGSLDISIAGTTYHLGEYHTILESAKVVDESEGTLSLAPGSSSRWVRRFGPPPESPQDQA
ncbi:hypothetical protein [Iamia sp.]|uniref:hypothetical protein n=1 Tax=Iamia sp. TaxID=2722710 RepID=UPI002C1861B7|nr:hypothetical protein [Iamia sp.]HXH57981.1 hypothetical protein [Iamia sp.]